MTTQRCTDLHCTHEHSTDEQSTHEPRAEGPTELTDHELRTIRGGDECLVGFRQIDLDGDGVVDAVEPIYEECLKSLSNTLPAV